MRVGIFFVCVAAAVLPGLQAQPGCPAINFLQGVSDHSLTTSTTRSVMLRQPDGSYTDVTYWVDRTTLQNTHQVNLAGSVANYQKGFVKCAGLGAATRHPAPGSLKTDPLGISVNTFPVTTDLAGNGTGTLLAFWPSYFGDQLLVEQARSDFSVATSTGYAVGAQPTGIIVADFNGDGKKDVAVIYAGPPSGGTPGGVSLLLGNGDGTLKPAVNYPTGRYPSVATAYDFNGDGRPDLAVANYDGTIKILLSNADGTLRSGDTYATNSNSVDSIAVADVNGDGKVDLLVFEGSAGIAVWTGKGDGTFQAGAVLPLNISYGFIGVGDFNKDGITDLAIGEYGVGVNILLGTGGGKFATPVVYSVPDSLTGFFVQDFDGDGNLDLVFAKGHPDALSPTAYTASVAVLFGIGEGTFPGPSVVRLDGNPNDQSFAPTNLVVADFNGDGKLDMATSNASGKTV